MLLVWIFVHCVTLSVFCVKHQDEACKEVGSAWVFVVAAALRGRLGTSWRGPQSGILPAQYRQFKSFGKIIVAKALAISIMKRLTKSFKSGIVAGENSQFLADVGNLSSCEARIIGI